MKEVVINGLEYLPATILAKDFRYTTDYIGQLCRSKKVDAQLIGRSWYVNPLSLAAHKKARYVKVQAKDTLAEESINVNLTRIAVPSALPRKVVAPINQIEKNFAKRIDWQPLKYETDKGELFPRVSKQNTAARVLVKLADSTDISIKTSSKPINMVAEALPSVSLSGVLNVTSLEYNFQADSNLTKSDNASTDIPLPPEPSIVKSESFVTRPSVFKKTPKSSFESIQTVAAKPIPVGLMIPPVQGDEKVHVSHFIEMTFMVISFFLSLSLLALFFGESNILASADSYDGRIVFTADSFKVLNLFFSY